MNIRKTLLVLLILVLLSLQVYTNEVKTELKDTNVQSEVKDNKNIQNNKTQNSKNNEDHQDKKIVNNQIDKTNKPIKEDNNTSSVIIKNQLNEQQQKKVKEAEVKKKADEESAKKKADEEAAKKKAEQRPPPISPRQLPGFVQIPYPIDPPPIKLFQYSTTLKACFFIVIALLIIYLFCYCCYKRYKVNNYHGALRIEQPSISNLNQTYYLSKEHTYLQSQESHRQVVRDQL